MKKKKAEKPTEFWVEICEAEGRIICFEDKECAMNFAQNNGPVTIGTIQIKNKRTVARLKKAWKDGYFASSVSWNRYCGQLGYKKHGENYHPCFKSGCKTKISDQAPAFCPEHQES